VAQTHGVRRKACEVKLCVVLILSIVSLLKAVFSCDDPDEDRVDRAELALDVGGGS